MSNETIEKERKILEDCLLRGNKQALVQEYWNLVYFTVRKIIISKNMHFSVQDIESLRNDVFIQLFDKDCKKLRQYKENLGKGLTPWIKLVAVHTTINNLKKKDPVGFSAQKARVELDLVQEKLGYDEEERLDARQGLIYVQEAMKQLPSRYELVLKLHYFDGLNVQKVAKIINTPVERTHTVIHRAREKLKKILSKKSTNEKKQ